MVNIPVVFIHIGTQNHLFTSLKQSTHKGNQTHLIGTAGQTGDYYISHYIKKYMVQAEEFSKIYDHLSTNGRDIELYCFQRWFVLLEFMESNGIDVCLYLDSDVMLFCNAENSYSPYRQFDFTLTHRCCGSNSYFTVRGLSKFCKFLMHVYSKKNSYDYEKISSHYHIRKKYGLSGGVCDMTLLEYYSYGQCGKIGEMMHFIDDSTWDHNINESDQDFEMQNGTKNIRFHPIEGFPICKQLTTGKEIRFKSIHFQGSSKGLISRYAH